MNTKKHRVPLYKKIWCKIRYWQSVEDISDKELADYLQVGERTLREYDKDAKHVTLEKVDNFLVVNRMELNELLMM